MQLIRRVPCWRQCTLQTFGPEAAPISVLLHYLRCRHVEPCTRHTNMSLFDLSHLQSCQGFLPQRLRLCPPCIPQILEIYVALT